MTRSPVSVPSRAGRSDAGLAAELRMSVMRLSRRMRTERQQDLGLSSLSVLGVLARCGEQTVSELAEIERVKPPSMSRTVRGLEEAGLVQRRPHESDGRQYLVSLTEAGADLVLAERRRREAWLSERLAELTAEERATVRAAVPIIERLATTA